MESVPSEPEPVLTGEAARLIRVGECTIRRWADTGKLHVVRTATGLRVFDRREVERVAAARATKKGERWPP